MTAADPWAASPLLPSTSPLARAPAPPGTVEHALLALAGRLDGAVAAAGGLNRHDAPFAHSLVDQLAMGRALSGTQRRAGWRMLRKYADALRPLGVDYAAIPSPEAETQLAPSPAARRAERSTVRVAGGRIELRSPFALKDVAKSIPGRRWVKSRGAWTYPETPTAAAGIAAAFAAHGGIGGDPRFAELLAEHDGYVAAAARKSDVALPPIPLVKTEPWTHQLQAYWFSEGCGPAAMLDCEMGTGKAQPLDEPVLTPTGWVAMGSLSVGDYVIGVDGSPTRVVAVHERGPLAEWLVRFSDGVKVRCSADHLWPVRTPQQAFKRRPWKLVPTHEIRPATLPNAGNGSYTPVLSRPVDYDTTGSPLPLDPWLLGVLIGDGSLYPNTVSITNADPELVDRVQREVDLLGLDLVLYATRAGGVTYGNPAGETKVYGITARSRSQTNVLTVILAHLGLVGCESREKFIPERYLRATPAERLAVLRGLVDTDGHISGNSGGHVEFVSASRQLALDVIELARSLCGRAVLREKVVRGTVYFRVGFTLGALDCPASLSRKAERWTRSRSVTRRVVAVEATGATVPMRCITVAAAGGQYVTTDFVVTHNSKVIVDRAVNVGADATLILAPDKVVRVWPKQFRVHAGRDCHVLNGTYTRRDGQPQLLSVADRVAEWDAALHECGCGSPHVIVANYAIAVHEPFATWALEQSWDLAVCDEVHRIAAAQGKWSRWCYQVGRRAQLRIAGTGSLYDAGPLSVYGQFRFLDESVFGLSYTAFQAKYAVMGGFGGYEFLGLRPEYAQEYADRIAALTYHAGEDVLDLPAEVPDITYGATLGRDAWRTYKALEREAYAELAAMTSAQLHAAALDVDVDVETVTTTSPLVKLLRLQQITGGAVRADAGQYVEIDTAKADVLRETLEQIPAGEPVVVVARFIHDLDAIRRETERLGLRYAEISGRRGDGLTIDATLAEDADVVGAQIQAAGEGVDLTRSHWMIFYSLGFSLKDYRQMRKRQRRPGQEHPVRYVHLVVSGSVDEAVYEALAEGAEVADYLAAQAKARQ